MAETATVAPASVPPHESNVDPYDSTTWLSRQGASPAHTVTPLEYTDDVGWLPGHEPRLSVGVSDQLKTRSTSFRHSGWASTRLRIQNAFFRTLQSSNRVARFNECGCHVRVYRAVNDPDKLRLSGNYCRDRFCVPCARTKALKIARNLADHTEGRDMRFITLTIKSTTEDLPELIDHLYKSFRRLRANPGWKRHVLGSAAFLEIKYNSELQRWHPHLHILAEGIYYEQGDLSAQWYDASRGSTHVYIEDAGSHGQRVRYCAKYAGKAICGSIIRDPVLLDLAIRAVHRRRVCLTTGSFRGYPLLRTDDDTEWELIGNLDWILSQRNLGWRTYYDLVCKLLRGGLVEGLLVYEDLNDTPPEPDT